MAYRLLFGWASVAVPLRLIPNRGAARMSVGIQVFGCEPDDVVDLRTRTIRGEPSFLFATARPDVVARWRPYHRGDRLAELDLDFYAPVVRALDDRIAARSTER